ncbi:D-glycero-beta-D-manno-heptose 1,7-bisphosphate 7-phosphatase [Alkalilimnicola ehrlichii MLHE-1]|uniref:D,D-heptose 1,7-bisphosphate phosphatase n=1 Tax=Alkalilimnicola ehrlichii (strain ATCC BAA-1101 / DSM 17681 / MLHE-1) TaxID=187272 RepID=Q0ACR8_ALKEH|nr:D-glycero-beta-D-manno-heptose 1,7-bisphosphate 7-phosphatase [Alkalilimnicola ehrlichii]ABI55369.1 D-alpha,beta-D-heptose 1,7-bisphosphate phosphatase [Alkalilimnicola ehrlichii MLHE-1]
MSHDCPAANRPPLVILDRDGVINQDSDAYIKAPEEWRVIPGSAEAIARLNRAGVPVAVCTNQSGIGRGLFDDATYRAITAHMHAVLARAGARIDAVFHCPHRPEDRCECRKPRPGLLLQAAAHFDCPLDGVPVIGDSLRDLEAGRAVNARPMLVRTGKGARTLAQGLPWAVAVYDDLAEAVAALIGEWGIAS